MQTPAWAGLSNLSVDSNGDSVFNGDNEKLTITFTTSDFGEEDQEYKYEIKLGDDRIITSGPDTLTGQKLQKNQTVEFLWNGTVEKQGDQREALNEGVYTIRVILKDINDPGVTLPSTTVIELTIEATLDKTKPTIDDVSAGYSDFSPIFDTVPVYYTLSEDASEAWLEVQRAAGGGTIGRRIALDTTEGSHTFYWDGDDGSRRSFEDGKYKLRLVATDKGGNTADPKTTEEITLDSEEPNITSISINDSIPLIEGSFVNASIQSISFTADAGSGTPLNLSSRDTEIRIRPIGGTNLNGALTVSGNNKVTLALGNTIDDISENGNYDVTVFITDRVGNLASSRTKFTFDNVVPTLKSLSTNREEFKPGSGLSGSTNYVEAELDDNIELDLAASSIRLKGPDGSLVLGEQTQPTSNKIRWQLRAPLIVRDGIHDGQYNVEIVGVDKANNRTEAINISFLFDNLAPELVSLQPTRGGVPFDFLGDTVYYNLPLNQFVATFNDGDSGTGVEFTDSQNITSITFGTPKSDGGIDALSGRAFPDKNNNVLTYILNSPLLKTDGSQDGNYIIAVKAADPIGNSNVTNYKIIYDTQVPTLNSTTPAANQTVSSLSEVVIKLNEETSGIDFAQSSFRLLRGVEDSQVEIPVNTSSNGTDTVTLTLLQQIAIDGSDDGTYIIEVNPSDRAGNIGASIRRQFYLVSKIQPKVRLTSQQSGKVNSLGDITAVLENYIGSGINYDVSTITVSKSQGNIVPEGKVEYDKANNQLTWSTEATIPRNGTTDGEYSINVVFVDFSGKFYIEQFTLTLDTQYPSINTVEVGTDPQKQLSIESAIDVNETFSQINVTFAESDIDFENTVVSLAGPDGSEIALHRSNDGGTGLALNFQNLSELGTYTLTVTPSDNIGNVSQYPLVYRFHLDIAVPVVTTILIGGQSSAVVYVNESVGEIIATLVDTTGTGLAVGEGESSIVVTTELGLPVPGITTFNDENQLIWTPTALPTDGTFDGRYTVSVTPVDNAGRMGDVAFRSFIFDTQEPRVTSAEPVSLQQPISYIGGSISQFQFSIEDVGPALLDLDSQTISLTKIDGEAVAGDITHDGINQLLFTPSAPLSTDGSADGKYLLTVNLVDRAGNSQQVDHSLFYDSQVPALSTVSLNTETPLELTPYQVTDLGESVNKINVNFVESSRVDFANTMISLIGPDGSAIPFNLENNGVDQLTASFVSLIQGGLYTLSVTAQDIVGNSAQGSVPYPFRILFELPELSSVRANTADTSVELLPHEIVEIVDVINQVTLEFTDANRLDFENTIVELSTPNGQQIPLTQEENESSQLIVRFISVTDNGLYTLTVTPQDMSGNVAQIVSRYHFRLDIALPSVSSVLIDGQLSSTIFVNDAIATIVATFIEPAGVGLDFSDDGSSIVVTNENGVEMVGITQSNELNQLTWIPLLLPTDGSADGIYNVSVTPKDKVGRTGKVVNRQFTYDTQEPRITDATPIVLHQPTTHVGGSLTQFQISIQDVGPALLDLDSQTISLQNSDGDAVTGQLTHDGVNQLYFTISTPLTTDGTADGEYTLTVNLVDNAGNSSNTEHSIFYDSQAPSLTSVTLNTETPLSLIPYEVTELSETVSKLTLNFTDKSKVDFANTDVTLSGPGGSPIPLTLVNNGVDQLTANFVTLTQGGQYTLTVTPQDIAGNVAQGAVPYPFRIRFTVPDISSVKANTTDSSVVLAPYETINITEFVNSLTLAFTDAMQIDFENTRVTLSDPTGQEITVTLEEDDESQMVVRFLTLTQNGMYSLSVTPQDTAGNIAQSSTQYQFRIDLKVPALVSVSANTTNDTVLLTPFEVVEISDTVSSFALEFSDVMRIDVEDTNVILSGPNGEVIPVTLEEGEGSLLIARFVSLTQNGMYSLSVTPQDTEGNVGQSSTQYQFRIDLIVPALVSVLVNTTNDSVLLTPFEVVEISDTVSSFALEFSDVMRIDVEDTNVILSGPNGEVIPVTLEEGEGSLLIARFVSLIQGGMYSLSVTPQDTVGNVGQSSTQYQFRIDLIVPALVSVLVNTTNDSVPLTPFEVVEISDTVSSFALEFSDVMRIDVEDTNVILSGPNGEVIPVTLEEGEGSLLIARFVSLTQNGMYSLSVTPQDTEGNVGQSSTQYQFRIDLIVPALVSVLVNTTNDSVLLTPFEVVEISDTVSSFALEFSDVMRIDVEDTNVILSGPNGEVIPVTLEEGEGSLLIARFVSLIQGGMYSLSVTPQDTEGNVAQSSTQYQFRIDLIVPALVSVLVNTTNDSVPLTPFEVVEISDTVSSFALEFSDVMRIDVEDTNVILSGPNGEVIPVTLEEGEGSLLIARFVSLTQNGMYSLSVTPQDTVGNVGQSSTQYQFRIDLKVPELVAVSANIADTPIVLSPYEVLNITNSFSSITLEFTNNKNIDLENTVITLSGSNGQEIQVVVEEGEDSLFVIRFAALTESGQYTLSVTPQDKVGNVAQIASRYQFRLDVALPSVQSVVIDGKLGSTIYVSNSSPRIIASFIDNLGVGLSFGDNGSTIVVTNAQGIQVPGTTTSNQSNQLTWTPIPFATDGSADGQYNVAITPVDMAGRSGTVVNRQFMYDSQAPRITAATPLTLHAPVSYIGSGLSQFVLTIQDEGPAGFVLTSQVAALMDDSGILVPATLTHDELTDQLYLTLSTPFANDGSVDGTYTLNVVLIDKAGNRNNSQFSVVYDSTTPQLSSVHVNTVGISKELDPNEVTELSESISTITIKFLEATRVDFANTSVLLNDPSDLSIPITINDDGVSEMTISFANLTEIGQYILSITPQDIAGNTASSSIEYAFNLAFILPSIESILIGDTITLSSGDIAYVNADNLVIAANLLDLAGTGLSFDALTGSDILVTTLEGSIVFGSTGSNGVDAIVWEPITLSTDGSSDGRYAVYVTPVDKKGREGNTIYREFILDTQKPEITSANPINLSQPVSYISESLTQLQLSVQDVGPADLILEEQQVSLRDQNGTTIPTKLTNDNQSQLYLTLDEPLPLDGSRDGEYTVVIAFADRAGNFLSVEHPIVYDTQAPTLVSTSPENGDLLTEDLTQIVVNLNDEGDSGIDWTLTTVSLIDPNETEISGEVTSNGKTQLTLTTNQLVADGKYVIRVQAIDRAGNGSRSVFESSFILSRPLPAVISTIPLTAPEDEAYTNETVEQIEVILETVDERHLSTVRLLNADGQVVAGQQQRQSNKLIYELVRPLATDGSDDGIYTIEFTPISASGRSAEVQNLQFTYDTQVPELILDDIQLIVAEPEVNNSLVEIQVPLSDNQAGVDWENIDEDWLSFEQLTPNKTEIVGSLSYNGEQNILIFKLTFPLADNGSADGEYKITVTPSDKAGNSEETYEKEFTYDTSPPVIDLNTLLLNDVPLLTDIDSDDYPSAISTTGGVVIQASVTDTGLGVNLSQSSITVSNPNGQEISGTSQQNGVDTIVFKSDGLNVEGVYQVTITSTGNDSELLGFAPKDSVTAAFLYETTGPTGNVTNDGGKTEFTDEAIPFEGTATDPQGTRRAGQQGENEVPVPSSGVLLVEIVGTGPDGEEIEPVPAEEDSDAQAQPWSRWSVDFLPTRSGEYDLDLRVTDKAGNYTVYDIGEYTMSVSFSFKGNTFNWPNPVRKANGIAYLSWDLNASEEDTIDMTLYIYDWGGDLVYKHKYANIQTGQRDDTLVKWNLKNQAGNPVARGVYVFRLEAVNETGNRANAVGKILVVD